MVAHIKQVYTIKETHRRLYAQLSSATYKPKNIKAYKHVFYILNMADNLFPNHAGNILLCSWRCVVGQKRPPLLQKYVSSFLVREVRMEKCVKKSDSVTTNQLSQANKVPSPPTVSIFAMTLSIFKHFGSFVNCALFVV